MCVKNDVLNQNKEIIVKKIFFLAVAFLALTQPLRAARETVAELKLKDFDLREYSQRSVNCKYIFKKDIISAHTLSLNLPYLTQDAYDVLYDVIKDEKNIKTFHMGVLHRDEQADLYLKLLNTLALEKITFEQYLGGECYFYEELWHEISKHSTLKEITFDYYYLEEKDWKVITSFIEKSSIEKAFIQDQRIGFHEDEISDTYYEKIEKVFREKRESQSGID